MPYNSETETFYQAPATVVDSTPDGDTVQEGFDDRLTPAMAGLYADLNLLKADGMISVGIPATTTARGIGRVATSADLVDGATISNGPAFLAAGSAAVTTTPTAHAVPQADAGGKLDGWVSLAGKLNADMSNVDLTKTNLVLQQVRFDTSSSGSTSSSIPYGGTSPQNTEGAQCMSVTITPKSATSKIIVESVAQLGGNYSGRYCLALFKNSESSAFATSGGYMTSGEILSFKIVKPLNSPGTSLTISARYGGNGGTTYLNGTNGDPNAYGNTLTSSLIVTEYAA